jgi:hypothetical protein
MSRVVLVIEGLHIASYISGPLNALKCNVLVPESTGLELESSYIESMNAIWLRTLCLVPHDSLLQTRPVLRKG